MKPWARLALAGLATGTVLWAFRRSVPGDFVAPSKGVFVEYSLYSDPAESLRDAGIDFVILQTAVQKRDQKEFVMRDGQALRRTIARINPPGLKPLRIWLWGWPIPSRYKEFTDHIADVIDQANGYVLNIEAKSWSTRDQPKQQLEAIASDLIRRLRAITKKPLFLSSHGRADFAPLPWDALSLLDGGMPQVYDPRNKYDTGLAQRCIDSYRKKGFSTIWPTLGATDASPENMRRMLAETPCVQALTWWSWTTLGRNSEKREIVKGARACQS